MIDIGYEELTVMLIDIAISAVLACLFFLARKSSDKPWLRHFSDAMRFMSLSYIAPYALLLVSVVILEEGSENYAGFIATSSYLLLSALACFCLVSVYRARNIG